MKSKKKSANRNKSSARTSGNPQLSIEVLQFGAPQASGKYTPRGLFSRRVSFGSSRFADMQVPFSKLPGRIPMFEIRRGKVFVVLDPRTEGFLNRGGEFGDVREFLSPRGAIAEIASIDDPLHLEIQPGSRGSLRIYGFEVIFKFEAASPTKKKSSSKGESRGAFLPPDADSSIEKTAKWISFGLVSAVMVPFTLWLMHAPISRVESVSELPQALLGRVMHPDHFAVLPLVFDDYKEDKGGKLTFDPDKSIHQAAFWVQELQRRWNAAENGEQHESPIEVLRHTPSWNSDSERMESWRVALDQTMNFIEARRVSPDSERYYRFQAPSPRFVTVAAGEVKGSFRARLLRRIEGVRQVNRSLRARFRAEQRFLRDYYKGIISFRDEMGPDYLAPGSVVFGPKPDPEFALEKEAFVAAQETSNYVRNLDDRWGETELQETPDEFGYSRAREVSAVWLSRRGVVAPGAGSGTDLYSAEKDLVQNALFSIAAKPVPPPPPPKAQVDNRAVEALIVSRREELRSCFEAALRRNPKLAGTVRMKWTIDERGSAQNPAVSSSTLDDSELVFCLKARVVSWRFPRPVNGAVTYEYPFRFSSKPR